MYLDHLPAQETVLNDGGCQPLVSAAIAQLAVAIVSPAEQLPCLCIGKNMGP